MALSSSFLKPSSIRHPKSGFALDIGGEGRYPKAWNLNPSRVKTIGVDLGTPIPRLILGRPESIPLPTQSVDLVLVERTRLKTAALEVEGILADPAPKVRPLKFTDYQAEYEVQYCISDFTNAEIIQGQ